MASIDWDAYREKYPRMSFNELQEANKEIDILYPTQRQVHPIHFARMIRSIDSFPLRVIELGSHDGKLARAMLRDFASIISWRGYDFDKPLERNICHDERYEPISLSDWFHKTRLPEFNAFMCSHTLEHLSERQLLKTLALISSAQYILIEIPISENGQRWDRMNCTHVLRWGLKHIRKWMDKNGFKIFYEVPTLGVIGSKKECKQWLT